MIAFGTYGAGGIPKGPSQTWPKSSASSCTCLPLDKWFGLHHLKPIRYQYDRPVWLFRHVIEWSIDHSYSISHPDTSNTPLSIWITLCHKYCLAKLKLNTLSHHLKEKLQLTFQWKITWNKHLKLSFLAAHDHTTYAAFPKEPYQWNYNYYYYLPSVVLST